MLFETQSNFYLQLAVLGGCSAVYLALIAYGCWQDASMTVKYTDVDYWILYDAAKLLLDGRSPFERSTYRYSPLLTLPLIFDHLLRMKFIGKLIFCFVTILIGQMLLKMLIEKQRMTTKKALFVCLAGWTLNPLVMGISTRGSSEAIVMLPLLLFTWYITVQRRTLAAISLGFAIHLKLFPIIYLPSVLVFYGIFPWTLNRTRRISDCATSVLSTPLKSCATSSEKPTNLYLHLKRRHFTFTLLTLMTAGLLFMATIYAFGEKGIQESLLYHLTRRDHRHNFSSFFTLFHNNLNEDSSNLMNKALLFLPQVAMMLAVSLRFGRVDLPFACFLQTWLFVAFNRVITSQYFVWFLFWLPLCINSLSISVVEWIAVSGVWLAAQGVWLSTAYRLEFKGEPAFDHLWLASLFFLLVNTLLAVFFIWRHKSNAICIKSD